MKALLAGMALLLISVSAHAAEPTLCSDGFDKPATLTNPSRLGTILLLTIEGQKPEEISLERGEVDFGTIEANGITQTPEEPITIVRNRVFRPCK